MRVINEWEGLDMFKSDQKNNLVAKEVIPVDSLENLKVELMIGIGNLELEGTTESMMEAEFEYPTEELRPKVTYKMDGKFGKLKVEQPHSARIGFRKYKYDWDVLLNKDVPMDLSVGSGAAKTDLNLKGLKLRSLDIQMGIGGAIIDLGGEWQKGFAGKVQGGVGKTKIILPKNTGVKLDIDKGIGKINAKGLYVIGNQYMNPCYEKADVKIELKLEIGVGSVELEIED